MARGTELAVGYVSIVAETSKLNRGIDQALDRAGFSAQTQGRRMGQSMGAGVSAGMSGAVGRGLRGADGEAAAAGSRMGQLMAGRMGSALKTGLATAGIAGGLAAVTAAMGAAVNTGVDFQRNLNTMRGVSQATAAEIEQVADRARQLGNDTTLVGATATDAAAAMTELVKNGFSVDQAMQAARGSMQLAAAAQVSAAEAATIQGRALQAFGLNAQDAGRVADVLANGANASSAEIADLAYGLQAGSAVANQFGISVEETVSTLGLLANAGIVSSDAGTLLKSMLLAIASPSDQASTAMTQLGLSVWDAQGNFVGMRELMGQLEAASKRLTPELYAMYTSTAFGSDAARLAGVAAEQGAAGFDQMTASIGKTGSAAALAAANTEGLPGVFERLSNTADRAKLALYGAVDGPLQSLGNLLNTSINTALDDMEGGVGTFGLLADTAREAWPVMQRVGSAIMDVVQSIGSGGFEVASRSLGAMAEITESTLLPALEAMSGLVGDNTTLVATAAAAWLGWRFISPMLTTLNGTLQSAATRTGAATTAMRQFATAQGQVVTISRTMNSVVGPLSGVTMGRFGSSIAVLGQSLPVLGQMQTAFVQGRVAATNFGSALGTMRAAMVGMRTLGMGILNVFGGPWSAALVAATAGIMFWADSVSQANQRSEQLARGFATVRSAAREMYELLAANGGELDDGVIAKANEQVTALFDTIEASRRGAGIGDWLRGVGSDLFGIGDFDLGDAFDLQGTAEQMERVSQTMRDMGVSGQQVASVIYGSNDAWNAFADRMNAAGEGGRDLVSQLIPLRQNFVDSQAAAKNLTPGLAALSDQMQILADTTSTADEKTNALKASLDILAGKQPDVQQAEARHNEVVRETAQAAAEAADQTQGYGDALIGINGAVDTTTANGAALYESLVRIKDSTAAVAGAEGDIEGAFRKNAAQLDALAEKFGLTREQIDAMATSLGYLPDEIRMLMSLEGSTEAEQELKLLQTQLTGLPAGKTITVDSITQTAEDALESVGLKVDHIEVHGKQQVVITSNGAQTVINDLQAIIDKMMNVPSQLTLTSALRQLGDFNSGSFATRGDQQRAQRGNSFTPGTGWFPYDPANPPQPRAMGGSIRGAGRKGKDSVPIIAAPGEHMLTDSDVDLMGGQDNVYAFRAALQSGLLPGMEEGGAVDLEQLMLGQGQAAGPQPGQEMLTRGGIANVFDPETPKGVGFDIPQQPGNFNPAMLIDTSNSAFTQGYSRDKSAFNMKDFKNVITQNRMDVFNKTQDARRNLRRTDEMWKFFSHGQDYSASFFADGGAILGYEEGGEVIDPRIAAIQAAFGASGMPYVWGGANPAQGGMDCSGYLSYVASQMTGRPMRFVTDSDFEAMGFVRGFMPGTLNVGTNGGSGKNGHMAGTLPNGINIESGGSSGGVSYGSGPGAAGFSNVYHLPLSVGPGAGGNSITDGGGMSVEGSPMMGPGMGSTPAEMALAAGMGAEGAPRTEGYIPASAGNTGVAGTSFASGLLNMGAEAVNGLIDQAASAASTAAAAAVAGGTFGAGAAGGSQAAAAATQFAIGMGTNAAKRGVSYGFQMAGIGIDALTEILTPFGAPRWLGYDYTGFLPQMPNMAAGQTTGEKALNAEEQAQLDTDTAQEQQQAQTGAHMPAGATPGQSILPGPQSSPGGPVQPGTMPGTAGAAGAMSPAARPPGTAQQPGTGQNPGAPSGQNLFQSTNTAPQAGAPAGGAGGGIDFLARLGLMSNGGAIYDEGGVMESGTFGLNLSGKPEPVLTNDQWGVLTSATEALDPSMGGGAPDFSVHVGQVTVKDVEEFQREMNNRQQLQMMRYAGRSGGKL